MNRIIRACMELQYSEGCAECWQKIRVILTWRSERKTNEISLSRAIPLPGLSCRLRHNLSVAHLVSLEVRYARLSHTNRCRYDRTWAKFIAPNLGLQERSWGLRLSRSSGPFI